MQLQQGLNEDATVCNVTYSYSQSNQI